jgi:hypothetical protein
VHEAVDEVGAAIGICLGHSEDNLWWLRPFARAAAVRTAIACTLLDGPIPTEVTARLADTPADRAAAGSVELTDPADQFKARSGCAGGLHDRQRFPPLLSFEVSPPRDRPNA